VEIGATKSKGTRKAKGPRENYYTQHNVREPQVKGAKGELIYTT
jgi:hypothetical protein